MKTTDKDSNIKPINEAVESEKLVNKPAGQEPVLENAVEFSQETADIAAGEQLDLALPESQIVAMADAAEDNESKRKEKKDQLEQDNAEQVIQSAEEQVADSEQSDGAGEEAVEADGTSEAQGEVAEALAEQSAAKGFGVYLSQLSTQTLVLGSLGILGAASYYRNKDDFETPVIGSGEAAQITENTGAGQVIYTASLIDGQETLEGIKFSLAVGSDSALTINATTGEVSLSVDPLYYDQSSYSFSVIASDANGNVSEPKAVVLSVIETLPQVAEVALTEDSGISDDAYSNNPEITVTGIKLGAKWEYSTDNGVNWVLGSDSSDFVTATFSLTADEDAVADGIYLVLVRQTNTAGTVAMDTAFEVTIDQTAPVASSSAVNFVDDEITITFSETLDEGFSPLASDFTVTRNAQSFTVESTQVIGDSVVLSFTEDLTEGALQIEYQPSGSLIRDIAGNALEIGFTQLIVSDGYIRSADIYIDRDGDGEADTSELVPGVTTDSFGQVILSDDIVGEYSIIIQNGIDVSTGVRNEIQLTAPSGYSVVNPFTTLVDEIFSSNDDKTLAEAETELVETLGIELSEGQELSSYDPFSDDSDSGFANLQANIVVASVLALSSDESGTQQEVLSSFASKIVENETLTLDAAFIAEVLNDAEVESDLITQVGVAVDTINAAENKQALIVKQAEVLDNTPPGKPGLILDVKSNAGESDDDALTNDVDPKVKVLLDTKTTDGEAVVEGDKLEFFDGDTHIAEKDYILTRSDIEAGYYETVLNGLQNDSNITVTITDKAGKSSVESDSIVIDTAELTFDSSISAGDLDENEGDGMLIYTASVIENDLWKFELSEGSDPILKINESTGAVSLVGDLDYESQHPLTFTVIATDRAGNTQEQEVTLNINNLDEQPPIITSGANADDQNDEVDPVTNDPLPIDGDLNENSGPNQPIYTAVADDSADISGGVTYRLTDDSDDALTINSATGVVTLTTEPDHEAQSQYSFSVIATDAAGNVSASQAVTLEINDLDDSDPTVISADVADVAVNENSGSDQLVYTASAKDDGDISGGFSFSLAPEDTGFSINPESGKVTTTENFSPDYEQSPTETFTVIVTDKAQNTSSKVVTLTVNNLDEVSPDIKSPITATVLEGNESGQVVYTAVAEDKADTSSGTIEYSLEQGDLLDPALVINAVTGEVSFNKVADYETQGSYTFAVLASDTINKADRQLVTLNVINVDEAAPTIGSGATGNDVDETSDENPGVGQVVYTAEAQDFDFVGEEEITFSLKNESLGFSIDSETGVVTTNSSFVADYEAAGGQSQSFIVVATDGAGLSSEKQITVSIIDVDEEAPEINSDSETAMDENLGAGIGVYTATSNESGVVFSLSAETDTDLFSINSNSGTVTFKRNPDYEDQDSFSFGVIATDGAQNVSETQLVTLNINNIDDRAPEFTSNTVGNSINEDTGAGVSVYSASATDTGFEDEEEEDITYSLKDNPLGLIIDPDTGVVTTNTNFEADFESDGGESQSFTVVATDAKDNFTEQDVTVAINNVDEAAPSITSGATGSAIDEGTGSDQVIYTAVADDSLDISNGVTYSLISQDGGSTFIPAESEVAIPELAAATQHVYVSSSTKSEDGTQETIVISYNADDTTTTGLGLRIHFDSSVLSASDITALVGTDLLVDGVVESDDNNRDGDASTDQIISFGWASLNGNWPGSAPVDLATITFDIAEGATGSSAINFTASSNSVGFTFAGQNHQVAIEEEIPVITIDSETGEVTLAVNPDYEVQPSYSFTVVATDAAGNASDEQEVTIDINNVDEVAPTINSGATGTAVDENSDAGQVVYTASATDTDFNGTEDITFSLKGNPLGFSIDGNGVVTKIDGFAANFEDAQTQSFTVVATDAAGNFSEQEVTIAINNFDEVAPTINSGATGSAIDENSGAGQTIYTASATDADFNGAEDIAFSLKDEDLGFSIDAVTGEVTTNADFSADYDVEGGETQSFTVVATDAADNASEQEVTIAINNLDEVAPSIMSGDVASVLESANVNAIVYQAVVDDSSDISEGVTFTLSGQDAGQFDIDSEGKVSVKFDPEASEDPNNPTTYDFIVNADDGSQVAQQAVTLTVVDQDLEGPNFTSAVSVDIDENSGENQIVYIATSQDQSEVTYSLKEGYDPALLLNSGTGEVTLLINPDYEVKPTYSFTVVATDSSPQNNSSEHSVTLTINNLDEVAPAIDPVATDTAVDEDTGAGIEVYTATASDTDFNGTEDITFSLKDETLGFSIDAEGVVTTNADFSADYDVEGGETQSFTVVATDAAGNASEQEVTIDINNVDEVAPTINSGATGTAVDENSDAGQVVYTASATDTDFNGTEDITFSLKGNPLGFSIDGNGVVTKIDGFAANFEDAQTQSFTVVATDAAGNASEQEVTIAINNLDEVAPTINSGATGSAVDENSGAGQTVYTASATDTDFNGTEDITISLKDEDLGFSIDAVTGEVTTNAEFSADYDVEGGETQSFTVVATDAAGNSSEQVVTIDISNLDDTAPSFTSNTTAAAIDENSAANTVIYTAIADDSHDISAGVTYSLVEDNVPPKFSINKWNGEVTLLTSPDFEETESLSFTVVATDGVNEPVEQQVTIAVNNLDEVAPEIISASAKTETEIYSDPDPVSSSQELEAFNKVVYSTEVDDSIDVPASGSSAITYKLTDDSDNEISIDSETGEVTLNTDGLEFSYIIKPEYTFGIIATDAAGNESDPHTVILSVEEAKPREPSIEITYSGLDGQPTSNGKILVSNIKPGSTWEYSIDGRPWVDGAVELPPVSNTDIQAQSISEGSDDGQAIHTATFAGNYIGNSDITFVLSNDSDSALNIDSSTGEVSLTTVPNYETQNQYIFTVQAVDNTADNTVLNSESVSLDINDLSSDYEGAFTIVGDGSYTVDVRVTNAQDESTSLATPITVTVDSAPATPLFVNADSGSSVINVVYNESLDTSSIPLITDYTIVQQGSQLIVEDVQFIDGQDANGNPIPDSVLLLTISEESEFSPGALDFTYEASETTSQQITDLAGNKQANGFSQMIVSDGYIRDAEVYVDVDGDGIADEGERRTEVTSDSFGQIILSDEFLKAPENTDNNGNPYQIIIKGGVNVDSGAPNEIELTAPAGYSVINPLSTLVNEIAKSFEINTDDMTAEEIGAAKETAKLAAEESLADSLGISLQAGDTLGSYDPQSDNNVANRVIATQIATVLAVASSTESEGAETAALAGLAGTITQSNNALSFTSNASINFDDPIDPVNGELITIKVYSLVAGNLSLSLGAEGDEYPEAHNGNGWQTLSFDLAGVMPVGQTEFILAFLLPEESEAGDDATIFIDDINQVANANTSALLVDFDEVENPENVDDRPINYELSDTAALDVSPVILDSETVTDALRNVNIDPDKLTGLQAAVDTMEEVKTDQSLDLSVAVEQIVQAQAAAIDTVAPSAPVPALATESNSGVYDSDNLTNVTSPTITFELETLAIDGSAVVAGDTVKILANDKSETYVLTDSDIELGSFEYNWQGTLTNGVNYVGAYAIDRAGNESEYVSNFAFEVDTTALDINSGETAESIDENSGDSQVIYTATVDSDDLWKFELTNDSDSALSINHVTGEVTLSNPASDGENTDLTYPDFENKPQYTFTVKAYDNAGNTSVQEVTLDINNIDEVQPVITSVASGTAVDENSGAGVFVYTATATDLGDISAGVTFSLKGTTLGFSIDANGDVTTNADFTADYEAEGGESQSFTIVASDGVTDPVEQEVTIAINDLDDAAPTITSGVTATAMDENSGANQVVYLVTSEDLGDDVSDTPIVYSLAEGSDSALTIDSVTGEVTLITDPDHETQSQYSFAVFATDDAGNASEAQSVTLDINDLDDAAPTITSGEIATAIDENSGANQVVYTVTSDDSGDDVADTPIAYSLAEGSDDALSINLATGEVTLTTNPDYESQSQYSFAVIATDAAGNASDAQLVTLDINNLDEVAATITSSDSVSASENSGADQVIYTVTADDSADISGGVTFSLAEGSDSALSIDAQTGDVTLADNPDYETQDIYSFTVVATDAAGNVSDQLVTLDISNLDDTAATITSGDTAVAVDENSGAGQVIYTATADDSADVSDGVIFSLAAGSDSALSIDADTGAVTLNTDPDFETQSEYSFAVVATDAAGNVSQAQSVTLDINNLDDTAATITSGDTAAAIDENSGAGQVIYTATADDSADVSDGVTFSLAAGSDAALAIDAATGEVTLSTNPDFETQSAYSFAVVATDAAGNVSQAQSVTLDINNVDDTAATITSGDLANAINENSGAGQVIYTATADDSADVSDGVTFSFFGSPESTVSIPELAASTQHVYVSSSTKSEDGTQETVVVSYNVDDTTTTGLGLRIHFDSSALSASASDITTLMTNDLLVNAVVESDDSDLDGDASTDKYIAFGWASLFGAWPGSAPADLASITFDIAEDSTGSSAINFTASSNAAGFAFDGQGHEIAIAAEADSDPALTIDSLTGEVTLITAPDHETQSQYSFAVFATDAAGNASEAQSVTLDINDLDDADPVITSSVTADAIDENSGAGQVIYTATADDSADVSDGVTFSLAEGSDTALSIDSVTGAVTLADNPDYETQDIYSFTVVATDEADNSSEQAVSLTINNVDDTAAVITSGDTADAIDENSGAGQVIYTATADDSADVSDGVTFSLVAGSDAALSIDADTGAVTLNADPDHETQSEYSFAVVATDAAGNVSQAQSVTLDINNLDDTAATITSGDTAAAINENSGAGQVIYTATADDSEEISGGVTFTLSSASSDALSIDAATGEVSLNTDPDFEAQSQYSFAVVATDAAGNQSEVQSVTLDINNLDDTAPVIESDLEVSLFDSASNVIYTVVADDVDSFNGDITYSFEAQSVYQDPDLPVGAFEQVYINNQDGSLSLQLFLDSSLEADYPDGLTFYDYVVNYNSLEVTVDELLLPIAFANTVNSDIPEQISIATIHYPQNFDFQGHIAQIDFDLQPGVYSAEFEITNILLPNNATPDDSIDTIAGAGSITRYLGNDGLSFNPVTGEVSLPNAPDALAQPVYSFTVTATDAAGNASTELITVIIDGTPVVTSPENPDGIEENTGSDQVIYTATASKQSVFSLAEGSDDGLTIDPSTGAVTLADDPDYETKDSYSFAVIATDIDDEESVSAPKDITVEVINLDESAATFDESTVTEAIDENIGGGQVVFTASADDNVDVSNGVTYNLSDERLDGEVTSDLLINAATGEVTLASNPDYETGVQYTFIVGATDGVNTPVAFQTVKLNVNNLDDAAPIIISGATVAAVDENSGAGQVIYSAEADDSGDISDGVTYSLTGDSDSALVIDSITGKVRLLDDPDYETQSSYSFTVIATDAAGNASEGLSLSVVVNNLDDTAPEITSADTADAIDENSGSQVIYTATASDSDDISGGVTLGLAAGSDSALSIDASTGEVTLSTNPDYETQSQYNFSVIATDAAGNTSESQSVTLDINNLDEAAPIITSAAETVVVDLGDTDPVIYTATADDSADISGGVSFSLNDTTVYASTDSGSAESTVSIPELAASTQHVYVSSSTKSEDGTKETIMISYNADDTTTTGLGLRIHVDSSVLSASDVTALVGTDLLVNGVVESDDGDLDGDASTDQIISFGWASLFGNWPGSAPADLASITFDIAEGATGSSAINFTASSNAAGFTFDGQGHEIAITGEAAPVESQLSIDPATGEVTLSGELDPATQSEYSFTVTATDTAGNSSDLGVVVDAEQPMVDAAMVVVVDGDTPSAPIYQASANIDNVSYQITDLTQYPDTDSGSGSAESQISIPQLAAATQHVYVSSSTKSEDGTQETVVVSYNADDTTTTGLGLRIHFDSSVLSASDITTLMTNDLLVNAVVESDDSDFDGDASTDTYVQFGWASLFGQWPNAAPVDLASITFDIAEGATGSSAINFSTSSNAAGFAFDGQDHNLVLAAEAVVPAAELVIDNAAGTVSLDAAANSDVMADYSFRVEGTDADGDAVGSQTVPVVVVDQIVNADASSYTGTADEDVFALADGSAEITSGAGEDDFVLDPAFASASHTITDFESGVDAIDISAALVAAGYTAGNAPTQLASAEMSADILDLVNGDDSSLDNLFGATYDDASNTLTVFADSDSSAGSTDMDSFQITLDDNATVEDDDIVANMSAFIA